MIHEGIKSSFSLDIDLNSEMELEREVLVKFGTNYSRMDPVTFFKGCLPQILLGPLLNALSHW